MTQALSPEDIPIAFQTAWNNHDMVALGNIFHKNATFVNRFGRYVKGVEKIIEMHEPIHKTIYSDSTLENEIINIDYMNDESAIIHFWSRLSAGNAHPAGSHQVDTIIMVIAILNEKQWLIRALENVTHVNPRTGEPILRGESFG